METGGDTVIDEEQRLELEQEEEPPICPVPHSFQGTQARVEFCIWIVRVVGHDLAVGSERGPRTPDVLPQYQDFPEPSHPAN